jgi:hypothetical protein
MAAQKARLAREREQDVSTIVALLSVDPLMSALC